MRCEKCGRVPHYRGRCDTHASETITHCDGAWRDGCGHQRCDGCGRNQAAYVQQRLEKEQAEYEETG